MSLSLVVCAMPIVAIPMTTTATVTTAQPQCPHVATTLFRLHPAQLAMAAPLTGHVTLLTPVSWTHGHLAPIFTPDQDIDQGILVKFTNKMFLLFNKIFYMKDVIAL